MFEIKPYLNHVTDMLHMLKHVMTQSKNSWENNNCVVNKPPLDFSYSVLIKIID